MATFSSRMNWDAVKDFSTIPKHVQHHLTNVYTTLTAGILSAAIGSLIFLQYHVGGSISFFAGILLMIWLAITPREEIKKRVGIFLGFCFMEGLSLGPLLHFSLHVDPTLVTTAFMSTVCVFASFSASAYFAQRRSYLYLGGLLGSGLSMLLMMSILNIFFQSELLANIGLYFGLLVFGGFIVFDTQLIIEKASIGEKDFVWDALQLFLDFVNVFVRILVILTKDKKERR